MRIELIAIDLDDTLLTSDMIITESNKKSISNAQAKGVIICLASGRPTSAMLPIAKELGIMNTGYIISYNGASIIDLSTQKEIYSSAVAKELAHELIELSKKHQVHIHTYVDGKIVTEQENRWTTIESTITGMPVEAVSSLKDKVEGEVVKLLMLETPERIEELQKQLKPIVDNKLTMFVSKPFFLEFMCHGTDKGTSLAKLAKHLHIPQTETMAIGDSYNDLSMIEWAGVGVAMNNAAPDIKNVADFVTNDNNNSGVAEAINRICLV